MEQEKKQKQKQGCCCLDRISELPNNLSHIILMFLPLRDMVRTSLLSKHWRYQWPNVPQLLFQDDPMYPVSAEKRCWYNSIKVLHILSQHCGPLWKLNLDMTTWPPPNRSAIHTVLSVLPSNGIKELTLLMPPHALEEPSSYKLPTATLSSCVQLTHLSLSRCLLDQPLITMLASFSKLVSLALLKVYLVEMNNVSFSSCPLLESLVLDILPIVDSLNIDAPNLKILHFIGNVSQIGVINTPHLKKLCLLGKYFSFTGNSSFALISFLYSFPLLEELRLSYRFLEVLAVRDSPDNLLKGLNSLLVLELDAVELCNMDELSSALWFTRSSPNLQRLKFILCGPMASLTEAELYLKMQDCSHYSLLRLREVEMVISDASNDLSLAILLSKFLLDVSPVLEIFYIEPYFNDADVNGYKRLVELASYPSASPNAKVVYVGPESLNLPK